MIRHTPVMVKEVIEVLLPKEGGIYIDATLGTGGHTEEILKYLGPDGRIIGIDRDAESLEVARQFITDKRVKFRKALFSELKKILEEEQVKEVDGIIFDLGMSLLQVKDMKRAFSFFSEHPLDMRMDRTSGITAEEIVNTYSARELERILIEYGEEKLAGKIAEAIVNQRKKSRIKTCKELADLVCRVYGGRGKIHPATKTFQALRIAVNNEINEIRDGLDNALFLLKKGGRLCAISYHSLEDRIVKNFMKDAEKKGILKVLTKKPLRPKTDEIKLNPASRSAKLRGAEKL